MNRRKFIIGTAAGFTALASGTILLTNAFRPPELVDKLPKPISPKQDDSSTDGWVYHPLNLKNTGDMAYRLYEEGSCMYGMFGSIIKQLGEQYGEPYASFPFAMMKYGSSGIGGYGSVCGALNGAAAVVGLFVKDKSHRSALIEDFFTWYENTNLPIYTPEESKKPMVTSVSNSVLCHVSTAKWAKQSGHRIDSKERKERCSRLTADVAQKTVGLLNHYFEGQYESSRKMNIDTTSCVQCHSHEGKMANIKGKMECASCHDHSLAHTLFADVHYKFME